MNPTSLELHTSVPNPFAGRSIRFEDAMFVLMGVPYDKTSSYRPGSRFAPLSIREASANIETYSIRSKIDLEDLPIHDAGDLHVVDEPKETLRRVEAVVSEIKQRNKIPVLLGGEHSITSAAVRPHFHQDLGLLSLDAHLDLRAEYAGEKLSHACFLRRIAEEMDPKRLVVVGARAISREELEFADKNDVTCIYTTKIHELGSRRAKELIKSKIRRFKRIYVTVDVDALDPAYAPGVGTPEADGLSSGFLLDLLSEICDERIVGFDLVEVAPHYDNGITSITAARIIFEIISAVYQHTHKT